MYSDIAFDVIESIRDIAIGDYNKCIKVCRNPDNEVCIELNCASYSAPEMFFKMSDAKFLSWFASRLKRNVVENMHYVQKPEKWWNANCDIAPTSMCCNWYREPAITVSELFKIHQYLTGKKPKNAEHIIGKPLTNDEIDDKHHKNELVDKTIAEYSKAMGELHHKFHDKLHKESKKLKDKFDAKLRKIDPSYSLDKYRLCHRIPIVY
jgi:DNA polymerase I-like protein with 3'-5' exonuclease and polymerase domains